MSATDLWLQQPVVQAVGWALLQFVWQGAVIALVTAVALAALHRSAADVRYVVATIALCLMVTMPIVTTVQALRTEMSRSSPSPLPVSTSAEPVVQTAVSASADAGAASTRPALGFRVPDAAAPRVDPWLRVMVLGWFAGVIVLTLRLMSAWIWVQRLKTHATAPVPEALQHAMVRLARRLHVTRRVRILQSALVDVPTVIGWIKPVVLLPVSTLAGLAPHQLEAIVAHELAHIRRHDYLVNLLQTAVETLLFYHPAVWWLSRRIRAERENCCDDIAVSLCGDPFTYAKALADLEELRGEGGQLAMAATGGSLLHRIRRIVVTPSHAGRGPGWLAGIAAVTLILTIAGSASIGIARQSEETPAEPMIESQYPPAPPAPPAVPPAPVTPAPPVSAAPPSPPPPASPATPPVPPVDAVSAVPPARAPEPPPAPPATPMPPMAVAPAPMAPPPAPPAPPAPPRVGQGRQSGNLVWSTDDEKLEIKYEGEFQFTEDDTDVKRMSPGSFIRIKEGGWFSGRSVEFRSDADGAISRRFWDGNKEKPFEPEGRQWLSTMLPRFIRQSGLGAAERAQRILKSKGPAGLLAEISLIKGSWAKRLYFTEMLKSPLDARVAREVLAQAGREIDSDYELATLLIAATDKLLVDDATRRAYFEAAKTIGSDYETRRTLTAALKRGPASPALMADVIAATGTISSDYEAASLLLDVVKLHALDATTRGSFFAAVQTIQSDYEAARVLKAVIARGDASPDVVDSVIRATKAISSNYEASQVLLGVAARHQLSGAARDAYIEAAERLGSYEQGQVLSALVKNERRGSSR